MAYSPQGQTATSPDPSMNQSKPEDPMAWHAQIAETDSEVKQERAYECNPFTGCCTIPELPSCSCEKGCCQWTVSFTLPKNW
jgi:hypothetical protein